jgi:alkaline phosphatase
MIYDASPAAFASHVTDRRLYRSIIEQYLKLGVDVLLGGGRDQFTASALESGQDTIPLFRKNGYQTLSERKELIETKGQKVLGLFSGGEMPSVLERSQASEPSLTDMTEAAIRILQQGNPRGFVLFIENEHTDTASHFSDAASAVHEFLEFDRAVEVGYRFYQNHPRDTLLLVTSDHETGGFQLIQNASEDGLKKIDSIRISIRKAVEMLGKTPSPEAVDRLMEGHFRGFTLLPEWREALITEKSLTPAFTNPAASILGAMIASQTGAAWTTSGHTNQPVFVAAIGTGAERFRGYLDNTEFGKRLIDILQGRQQARGGRQ